MYSAILIFLSFFGSAFTVNKLQPDDKIFTFTNSIKLQEGIGLYSQNNVIDTPIFFVILSTWLKIFGNNLLISTLLGTVFFEIIMLLALRFLIKLGVKRLHALLLLVFMAIPLFINVYGIGADYTVLSLLFWLLGMNLLLNKTKSKSNANTNCEKMFNINFWQQGIIASLIFGTKQNVGIYYLMAITVFTAYYYLKQMNEGQKVKYKDLKNKEKTFQKGAEFQEKLMMAIKELIKIYMVFAICTFLWMLPIILNGAFWNFINYCFGGIGEFASHNFAIDWGELGYYTPIVIQIIAIIALRFNIKTKNKAKNNIEAKLASQGGKIEKNINPNDDKSQTIGSNNIPEKFENLNELQNKLQIMTFLLIFSGFMILTGYPLFNGAHIQMSTFISFVALIFYIEIFIDNFSEIFEKKSVKNLIIIVLICFFIVAWGAGAYRFTKYINDIKNSGYSFQNPFFGYKKNEELVENIKQYQNFINLKKEQNEDVIMFSAEATMYEIVTKQNYQDFDLPYLGNWGYKGEERVLDKIKNLKDTYILIKDEDPMRQESKKIKEYIRTYYRKTGEIAGFDVYKSN